MVILPANKLFGIELKMLLIKHSKCTIFTVDMLHLRDKSDLTTKVDLSSTVIWSDVRKT